MKTDIQELKTIIQESIGAEIERIENDVEQFDPDSAIETMMMIADLRKEMKSVEDKLNEMVTTYMRQSGERQRDHGAVIVERRVSSSRKNWEHNTILGAVVNTSLSNTQGMVVDPTTGEMVDILALTKPIIDNVVADIVSTAAIREWRVTALRAMVPGLNPDDFCEVEKVERVSIRKK